MTRRQISGLLFAIITLWPILAPPLGFGQSRYNILLSNDDGIDAPGLAALVAKLSSLGSITVAASPGNQSGVGHGVTSSAPIRVEELKKPGARWYMIEALPATSVRLAIESLLPTRPDIVVAGINRGDATGVVSFYSATVACAREAAFTGLPAVSVHLERSENMDYEGAAEFVAALVQEIREKKLPPGVFLNVNIPALAKDKIRGVMITRQDLRSTLQFYEKTVDPAGRVFYLPSYKRLEASEEKTDISALKNGYISITPLRFDQTATSALADFESWAIMKWKSPGR